MARRIEKAGGAGVAVYGAIVAELVVVSEPRGGAPVDEFLFDGFAFGVVADDAAAAVSFEEEDLQLLLQPALTVDSIGFLSGGSRDSFSGGFRGCFRGHVGLSFCGFAAAGRGRGVVRWEIVRFVVRRLALAEFRSVAYLGPPARLGRLSKMPTPILDRWTLLNEGKLSGT
jgi:hypothetical protein